MPQNFEFFFCEILVIFMKICNYRQGLIHFIFRFFPSMVKKAVLFMRATRKSLLKIIRSIIVDQCTFTRKFVAQLDQLQYFFTGCSWLAQQFASLLVIQLTNIYSFLSFGYLTTYMLKIEVQASSIVFSKLTKKMSDSRHTCLTPFSDATARPYT